ncbi:helix-turn-helix domain-containing protein [Nocardioides luteus]|uniref:helix-turn-helix domain-containing protein n=1 Tax=Nocardioides luteus TaxID=1844 RepID=UPI0018CBBF4B|nr:XRE family transcriptional regulator [Nocardioides luteus]MBG6094797.1 Zn-dependent peptidase ImmA (M78 family)/DNA-binding XRE family transcriptional regulator [Nocardioides luteus]
MADEKQGKFELFSSPGRSYTGVARAFDPARLTQARVLREWTKAELAEEIRVSPAAVGQYEAGASTPRADLLPLLANKLKVPVDFFAAGRPLGRLDAANAHFRSLRSTRAKDRAKAATHAEQVWELTYALEKRVRLPDVDLPKIPEGTTPAEAAQLLRQAWEVGPGPFPHLAATIEAHGIVVTLIPLTNAAVTRVSAYSTDALGRPLIIVTPERAVSVSRYRFTCAHEVGHLLLHPNPLPGDRQQEREADEFAAELLTPRTEIEPLLPRTMRLATLEQLSQTWGVSIESLVRRMAELRVVSEVSMRRAYQRLRSMAEFRRDEPIATYPGEVPSLLREALTLAEQHGLTRADLANELCWATSHLSDVLGESDPRPQLHLVRD